MADHLLDDDDPRRRSDSATSRSPLTSVGCFRCLCRVRLSISSCRFPLRSSSSCSSRGLTNGRRRAPRTMPQSTSGHLISPRSDPLSRISLTELTKPNFRMSSWLRMSMRPAVSTMKAETSSLERSMIRHISERRVEHAALVVATQNDQINTNIAFTVRNRPDTTILSSANFLLRRHS